MLDVNEIVGREDIVLVTLDTLRYDVARDLAREGRTPNLARWLPEGHWEERHTAGSFTFAAHQAFFAGFLPTPIGPGPHPRLFAAEFPGAESVDRRTCVFETANIVAGLAARGYRTICIGGVGFFNRAAPLGSVLPDLFSESHWSPELGVTDPRSTEHQVSLAIRRLESLEPEERVFLFINISALHQPNYFYRVGATEDDLESHAAALEYVDRSLPPLFEALQKRSDALCILCSDHGTAYGEDGYRGHRLAHEVVWTVPYAEFQLRGDRVPC
ncbi:MAG: STM4013/SEN3800 family hydrolase [Planctomycetota bacterium]